MKYINHLDDSDPTFKETKARQGLFDAEAAKARKELSTKIPEIKRKAAGLRTELGREPTRDEIAKKMAKPIKRLKKRMLVYDNKLGTVSALVPLKTATSIYCPNCEALMFFTFPGNRVEYICKKCGLKLYEKNNKEVIQENKVARLLSRGIYPKRKQGLFQVTKIQSR